MSAPRLSHEVKQAIISEYASGEKIAVIAAKYGVDQTYPGLLYRRSLNRKSKRRYEPRTARSSDQ